MKILCKYNTLVNVVTFYTNAWHYLHFTTIYNVIICHFQISIIVLPLQILQSRKTPTTLKTPSGCGSRGSRSSSRRRGSWWSSRGSRRTAVTSCAAARSVNAPLNCELIFTFPFTVPNNWPTFHSLSICLSWGSHIQNNVMVFSWNGNRHVAYLNIHLAW